MPEPSVQTPLEVDDIDRLGAEKGREFERVGDAYAKKHDIRPEYN